MRALSLFKPFERYISYTGVDTKWLCINDINTSIVERMRGSALAVCQPENLRDILQGVNPVCEKERKHVKRFYVGRGKTFNTLLNGWAIHIKIRGFYNCAVHFFC